jgi:hypothetical protein
MLSDDTISAYLDDELDLDHRAIVEQHLRADKAAAARLERLQAADNVLQQAFAATSSAKDDRLAAIIVAGGAPEKRHWATHAAALAAAVAVGLLAGQFARVTDRAPSFALSEQHAQLLDSQVSGRVASTDEGAFEVVLSLQSDGGEVCRQFRLTRDMQSTDVLACRGDGESWRMVAAASARQVEGYVPASGDSLLDAAIQDLGAVRALDLAEESDLIDRDWRPLPSQ